MSTTQEAARRRGPKPKMSVPEIELAKKMHKDAEMTIESICAFFGISRPTLYKALRTKKEAHHHSEASHTEQPGS